MELTTEALTLLTVGVFVVAVLYSSVGHAGASGYIAVMSLMGISAAAIKPTSLVLNILVATIGTIQYVRAGHFSWRLFWPFAVLAIPMAFVGGALNLPVRPFKIAIGVVLLYSAVMLFVKRPAEFEPREPRRAVSVLVGAVIGLLSGLTGTGGGIFLTPLLLFRHWAMPKTAAAISIVFILVNSVAGLAGNISSTKQFPTFAFALLAAAGAGGAIGSHLGSRRLPPVVIIRVLASVLVMAGIKLILTK